MIPKHALHSRQRERRSHPADTPGNSPTVGYSPDFGMDVQIKIR